MPSVMLGAVTLGLVALLVACDPCSACDAEAEYCRVQEGCRFLQNGNPNPFGSPDTHECLPLPEPCIGDVTCACLTCEEAPDRLDCDRIGLCSEEDGSPLRMGLGCE